MLPQWTSAGPLVVQSGVLSEFGRVNITGGLLTQHTWSLSKNCFREVRRRRNEVLDRLPASRARFRRMEAGGLAGRNRDGER